MQNVLIAIQARSTSSRLPNKHVELIGGRRIIDFVLDACKSAANYLNKYAEKNCYWTRVAVLVPYGDPMAEFLRGVVDVVEGPEDDVLKRYHDAAKRFQSDYIVRVTGDCPFIPPAVISKHIVVAIKNVYDYVSNVDERFRTSIDGVDCEVMSRRMLDWMQEAATDPADREHVTLMARQKTPPWARVGFFIGFFDQSAMKLSVDTAEDLRRARDHFETVKRKYSHARRVFGPTHIHRF